MKRVGVEDGVCIRAVDRMDCLTEAYVGAVNLKKTDLDLMRGLFACYVRLDIGLGDEAQGL